MNGQLTASCGQTKIFSFEFAIRKAVSMPEGLFLHRNSCFVLAVETWTRDCVMANWSVANAGRQKYFL